MSDQSFSPYGSQTSGSTNPMTSVTFDLKLIGIGKGTAIMESYGGLQITEFYRLMNDLLLNHPWIFTILMYIKTLAHNYVPVRSGHLLDYILQTMKLEGGKGLTNSKVYHWEFSFETPIDRPLRIQGRVAHKAPETGYGKVAILNNIIPNVTVVYVTTSDRWYGQGTTSKGYALYLLNDPSANRDFAMQLLDAAEDLIQDTLDTMVFEVTLRLAKKWGLGTLERKVHV